LEDYQASLRINPMHYASHFSRGNIYLLRGDYRRAIAEFDAGLAVQSGVAPVLYRRGVAKLKLGMPAEGNADIEAAAAINPRIAEIAAKEGVTP
jgi:tetratricopeptide (TPR) repeat protein